MRAELAAAYDPLARHLAGRFAGRGEPFDDLLQVARLGLLRALDRFDPGLGYRFATYATPTIVGELRRHFRDRGRWLLRVPRRLQEQFLLLRQVMDDLTMEFGRSPTVSEIARRCGLGDDQVLEMMDVAHLREPLSLQAPVGDGNGDPLVETIGHDDPSLHGVDEQLFVASLTGGLSKRDQHILRLRFVQNLSQREIGARVGVSQMQISRLLARTLSLLRDRAEQPDTAWEGFASDARENPAQRNGPAA